MTPHHESDGVVLYHGDCLQVLRTLSDESVDAVVSDPPYGLSFMGKRWDYDVPSVEIWQQVLRVLKPGGHLLAFAGTRTQHRMAVRIEDAGFEIRDMIAWVYGSGFSKGFNLKRAGTCKCGGNAIAYNHPRKEGSDGESTTEHELPAMRKTNLPQAECDGEEQDALLQPHLQQSATGLQSDAQAGSGGKASQENARPEQSGMEGRSVHRAAEGLQNDPQSEASTGETEWLRSGAHCGGRADAGQATAGGRGGSSHQPQQGGQQAGEFAGVCQPLGALDAGALRGRGQCPQCGKLKAEFDGWSSSLKPALEPITVARKPLCGTVAENVLQHGTGGLNVDGCRVGATVETWPKSRSYHLDRGPKPKAAHGTGDGETISTGDASAGRWPANLIHDGSDDVVGLFPETAPAKMADRGKGIDGPTFRHTTGTETGVRGHDDSGGSAARFFYCAKASKRDRGESNRHPTVKPTALMRYLCRLITPPGGLVLDPFTGSGSTGRGAVLEGFRFIGMELDAEHVEEAKRRILEVRNGWTDEPENEPAEDLPGQRLLF